MAKVKKPSSRRPSKNLSKKKLKRMEFRKRAEKLLEEYRKERERYTYPKFNTKEAIEECQKNLKEGKLCYCREKCDCRECNGDFHCDLEMLKEEGGCEMGCYQCPECKPCWKYSKP